MRRRFSVGAELVEGGVHFRVWAPQRKRVDVALEGHGARAPSLHALAADGEGYFAGLVAEAKAGTRYRYRLDGGDAFPDPASRAQPEGPHQASCVVDSRSFRWTDEAWRGSSLKGQVAYELHVGTFTREGTWAAAAEQLPELARAGITLIEMMPIAEFSGEVGWGYDGVDLWAPTHLYGAPDDLRRFIDRAHAVGVGVILDVVYNHFGPDGNYLAQYAKEYFSTTHATDWGEALNFDGELSGPVREFFASNAEYWIDEYHFDGLRFDATQDIHDEGSAEHVLAVIARRARQAAGARSIVLVAENEPQEAKIVRAPERGGYGLDALWNDDLHHTALVALTGRAEAYYTDYYGSPQELISSVKYGYLYQGQRYSWQKKRRGVASLDVPPAAFFTFLENHDQVANSATGARVHQQTSPARMRAMTAMMLLAPGTPMLFQGQEFGSSAPFLYFADHGTDLATLVRRGRAEFLAQFPSAALPETQARLQPPDLRETFDRCKLDFAEREHHAPTYAMHCELLALRKRDPVFAAQRARGVDGAVLGDHAFVLRFFGDADGDRLVIVNLGADLSLIRVPEPLLAPPEGARWATVWSSDDARWGGVGARLPESETGEWHLPAESTTVLASTSVEPETSPAPEKKKKKETKERGDD